MNKTTCEISSSARGGDILSSPNQSQASSAVISCSTSVEHTPTNVDSCSTAVEHTPTNMSCSTSVGHNVNATSDPGFESESEFNHQKPKSGPKKKVQFSQEEVEDDTHDSLQPTSNTTSSNAQVRNVDVSYQKLNTRMYISKKYQATMCSKTVSEELVSIFGQKILEDIVQDIKESGMYTIISDDTSANNNTEFLTLGLR